MTDWQPIETAPKDGTRVMLWRGSTKFGKWAEMVIAEWINESWRWPDSSVQPSTHGEWTNDEVFYGYESSASFTHWQPLPEPPHKETEK